MPLPSIFNPATTKEILDRLNKLSADTPAEWGKMNVSQMLAHLNVGYDLTYGKKKSKGGKITKFMLKLFVKKSVVSEKPYKRNGPTSPDFVISDERDFETEKKIFSDYVKKTEQHGVDYFEGKESPAFGPLTNVEWSNQFYKHIDHHFMQFGV